MPKGVYERKKGMKIFGPKLSPREDKAIAYFYTVRAWSQNRIAEKFYCGRKQVRDSLKRTGTSTDGRKSLPMEKNPAWKGGKRIDADGYVSIRMPDHPNSNGGYVLEHRLVMEKALGRFLDRKEVVHHKNGNKQDNHIENLLLFQNNGEHLGVELLGKKPRWTKAGLEKIRSRSIPSMKGISQSSPGSGVRTLRRKKIQEFLHETSDLQDSRLEVKLNLPPCYRKTHSKK